MKKPLLWSVIGMVAILLLAFAYYALSPLFTTLSINEAPPADTSPETTANERAKIVDTPAHPAQGYVRIVRTGKNTYVRYEELATINGPDIYVYLAKDLAAKEFVSLGKVKATEGNVNYLVPDAVRVEDYQYVLIWCKAFGVLFNYADLSLGSE